MSIVPDMFYKLLAGHAKGSAPANAVAGDLVEYYVDLKGRLHVVLEGGSDIIMGVVGIDQTTPGTTNKVSIGTDGVLASGSSIIGKVGIDQTTPGVTNGVVQNVVAVTLTPVVVACTNANSVTGLAYNAARAYCLFANRSSDWIDLWPVPVVSYPITGFSGTGTTVTVTCSGGIVTAVNQTVVITGATAQTGGTINGTFIVNGGNGTTTFTFANTTTAATVTGATVVGLGAAVSGQGIGLAPYSGSYELPDALGHMTTQAFAAISATGTAKNLTVVSG